MFARFCNWLDHRSGYRKLVSALLIEEIPGGAKWRYAWGSCLSFVFVVQLITGLLLMTAYSAGDSTAWSSVWFIQYQMQFGWLIRGLHHFGSQTMVVLLGIHMLQVVIAGAHLPPREINWWLGLALMGVVLGLSLTGYLLPWDQKGLWATQVATNIAGNLPVLGPFVQKVVVGGPQYGHHTLSRFFTLHVGVLPATLVVLLIAHVTLFRRHGVTTPKGAEGEGWFWPDQAFKDMVVSMIVFGVMLALVLHGHGHPTTPAEDKWSYDYWAHAGRDGKGANLDAPADPSQSYPARPEWYFFFLFQMLKYFEGSQELVGTVIIPTAVGVLLFLLPLFGYGRMRPFGHVLGILVVTALLAGAATLTLLAIADDTVLLLSRATLTNLALRVVPAIAGVLLILLALLAVLPRGAFRTLVGVLGWGLVLLLVASAGAVTFTSMETDARYLAHMRDGNPEKFDGVTIPKPVVEWVEKNLAQMTEEQKNQEAAITEKAQKFQDELAQAGKTARRAVAAAGAGVPAAGGLYMVKHDPETQGPELFQKNCATCHTHGSDFKVSDPRASDLAGFGSKEWIRGLLAKPDSPEYFGRTKLKEMSTWVNRTRKAAQAKGQEAELEAEFDAVAAWLASHPRPDDPKPADEETAKKRAKGLEVFQKRCIDCHTYAGDGTANGPDFTGYGDARWLRLMIMAPDHVTRYPDPEKNAMPAFRNLDGPAGEIAKMEYIEKGGTAPLMGLNDVDRELIIRWLLKDPEVIFGGDAIAPPGRK